MSVKTKIVGLLRSVFGIYRSGTTLLVGANAAISSVNVRAAVNTVFYDQSGNALAQVNNSGDILASGRVYVGSVSSADAGISRSAAAVVKEANNGWFVNAAGDKYQNSADTNTTTTLAVLSAMTATVLTDRIYGFEFVLFVEETTAADGLRVDFDGGTVVITSFRQNGYITDTAGVRSLAQTTALATDVTDTTTTGAAMAVFKGSFTVATGGTFRPRVAKEADAAGANLNIRVGTYLRVWDLTL